PGVRLVRLALREHDARDRGARELPGDVALLVQDVLDEAVEVVPLPLHDHGVRDPELLRVRDLELRGEPVEHAGGDDLADLHRNPRETRSRYSWKAPARRPSIAVNPSSTCLMSIPMRRASRITSSRCIARIWRPGTPIPDRNGPRLHSSHEWI